MGRDNLDVFEKIVFHIPSSKSSLVAMMILGAFYSLALYLSFHYFTNIPVYPALIPYLALVLFITPAIISGEVFHKFLPNYPRHWGYFLALGNQLFIFTYSMILTGANNSITAWRIAWLGLITVFLVSVLVLSLSVGTEYINRIAAVSLFHPVAILAVFQYYLAPFIQVRWWDYVSNFGVLLLAGFLLVIVFYLVEYLIGSNVSNVSAFELTSGLLQKKQEALGLGYRADPEVQTVQIENKDERLTLGVPWVHPGPLGGFGGGELTSVFIQALNKKDQGFFLHVPSEHSSDLSDPEDAEELISKVGEPEGKGMASKLFEKEYKAGTLYGRRFENGKIMYLQLPEFDDYAIEIAKRSVNLEDTVVVDLHNHIDEEVSEVVWDGTRKADELEQVISDFDAELDKLELQSYQAGFATDLDETPIMALTEEVDGQKTLLYGMEDNGSTHRLEELRKDLNQEFDRAVFFTTDTHASIYDMANGTKVEKERIMNCINQARSNLSPASIGMMLDQAENVKLLKPDYQGLIYSINILIRLLPLVLLGLYIILIAWVIA